MKFNKVRLSILKKKRRIIWTKLFIFGRKLIRSLFFVLISLGLIFFLFLLWFVGLFLALLFDLILIINRSISVLLRK